MDERYDNNVAWLRGVCTIFGHAVAGIVTETGTETATGSTIGRGGGTGRVSGDEVVAATVAHGETEAAAENDEIMTEEKGTGMIKVFV